MSLDAPHPRRLPRQITIVIGQARGHANAAFGLAQRLTNLGRIVNFMGPKDVQDLVINAGFPFQELKLITSIKMPFGIARRPIELIRINSVCEILRTIAHGRKEIRYFRTAYTKIQDELLCTTAAKDSHIFLFNPFYLIYALPLIANGNPVGALSTKPLASFDINVPPYTTYLTPGAFAFWLRNLIIWKLQAIKYFFWESWERLVVGATYRSLVEDFSAHCGLQRGVWNTRPILFDTRFRNCPEIVLHSPSFDFPRSSETSNLTHYVGPCVYHPRDEESEVLPPGNGPLIFIVLSTVKHKSRISLRRRMIRLFLKTSHLRSNWRFLIAAGDQANEIDKSLIPKNALIIEFAPAMKVLPNASILICQAGANLIKEAVWHEVPMVLFPDRADQPGNSTRVIYHGLGVSHRRLPNVAKLCSDIEKILGSRSIANNLKSMKNKLHEEEKNKLPLQLALSALEEQASIFTIDN